MNGKFRLFLVFLARANNLDQIEGYDSGDYLKLSSAFFFEIYGDMIGNRNVTTCFKPRWFFHGNLGAKIFEGGIIKRGARTSTGNGSRARARSSFESVFVGARVRLKVYFLLSC